MSEQPCVTQDCPACGQSVTMQPYDIGSGAEMACPDCEWCWGVHGQKLQSLYATTREAIAMQGRCPYCDGEQPVLNVLPFSRGEANCICCGRRGVPMTNQQWWSQLRATREAKP